MIEILKKKENKIEVKLSGIIAAQEFADLKKVLADFVNKNDKIRVLFDGIDCQDWQDLDAVNEDISLIKDYHEKMERVAIVADNKWLCWAARLAKILLKEPEVRDFAKDKLEEAREWIFS